MDTIDFPRFVFAFIFVISLIALMGYGLKRFKGAQFSAGKKIFGMAEEGGRIQIVEVRYLDPKRRLMLVRRDEVEHLILIADGRELLIESGIKTGMMQASPITMAKINE